MLTFYLRSSGRIQHQKAFQSLSKKGVIAAPIVEAPPIHSPYIWLWSAYCILSERRQRGGDTGYPQPILITEIKALAEYTGVIEDGEQTTLLNVVTALDALTISDYWEKRAEQQRTSADRQRR